MREKSVKIDHVGYALKDKRGRYYSSFHQGSVKRLKDCDVFTFKEAQHNLLKWNAQGDSWIEVVPVGLVEYVETK